MWFTRLYTGFETCFGPSTQGPFMIGHSLGRMETCFGGFVGTPGTKCAGSKVHPEYRCWDILIYIL